MLERLIQSRLTALLTSLIASVGRGSDWPKIKSYSLAGLGRNIFSAQRGSFVPVFSGVVGQPRVLQVSQHVVSVESSSSLFH